MTSKTRGKFLNVFVKLILGKNGVDGVTGPRREIDIRYKFDLKAILKIVGCKQRFLNRFRLNFQARIKFVIVYVRLILPKVGVDVFTRTRRESDA